MQILSPRPVPPRDACGVKGVKDARKRFWADAHTVILNGDRKLVTDATGTNLNAAGVADLADACSALVTRFRNT